ncbi:MAG: triose-phosphate isomerase [Verrucomicrobia bacterium]|nr:triose-phosphate isomerase [Verrucomicrobiota bacterium]MBS0637810.1 triose-phosphate isomerase [Verrucomicrobiota bacterium]
MAVLVGNWKMYKTLDQAEAFIDQIAPIAKESGNKIMLAVPYTAIKTLVERAKGTNIVIGAQNMNDASEGAFTGEVAALMLKDVGAEFVLLGHSERRQLFGETNAFINRKVHRALESGIMPLLCVGETYEERQGNQTEEVLKTQLTECLAGCDAKSLMVAYEPIWAIGTGLAATPQMAAEAMKVCRTFVGDTVPLLYGGSVNSENAKSFLENKEINGLLIGSASLTADSFAKIISLK